MSVKQLEKVMADLDRERKRTKEIRKLKALATSKISKDLVRRLSD